MWRYVLFTLVFSLSSASAADPARLQILASRTRAAMNDYVTRLGNRLEERAENPRAMKEILHYLNLKHWRDQRPQARTDILGLPLAFEAELASLENSLVLPLPQSRDGRLLSEYLYARELISQALELRLNAVRERFSAQGDPADLFTVEKRADRLRSLAEELQELRQADFHRDYVRNRHQEVSALMALEYENFLLELTRLPPNQLEKTLAFTRASFVEIGLIAGGILIAGADPRDLSAWLGLSAAGLALKGARALQERDPRYLLPFWHAKEQGNNWLDTKRDAGVLGSQKVTQKTALNSAGIQSQQWSLIENRFQRSCTQTLKALTQKKVDTVPLYTDTHAIRSIELPPL